MDLLKGEVLAIAGPQTSAASHFVAELGSTLQVPIVSFGATDPNLSAKQYSYFVRLAYSDAMQMAAIAAVVGYFGWKEVVAVYQDDVYGMNGIYILSDAIQSFRANIVYKAALPPGLMKSCDLENLLLELSNLESRVFIVHTPTSSELGISILSQANHLGLVTNEFVWIATECLSSFLIATENVNPDTLKSVQRVIGTRPYVPKSKQRRKFLKKWNEKYRTHDSDDEDEKVSVFALYAYDSIWLLARATNATLMNFTFGDSNIFTTTGNSDRPLKRFEQGSEFLVEILKTKFNGTSGPIQFGPTGDLMNTAFEIINIVGAECRTIGYWTNHGGLSTSTPLRDNSVVPSLRSKQQRLQDVVWPGNGKRVPRGWIFPTSGRKLRVGVPSKKGFKEFITAEGHINGSQSTTAETGFCVDVFEAAIKSLPYPVPYTFIPYGAGKSSPSYDDLVQQLVLKQVDAVVGDISITTNRSAVVDFTQPFIETGLVVVVPLKKDSSTNGWALKGHSAYICGSQQEGSLFLWALWFAFWSKERIPISRVSVRSNLAQSYDDAHTPMGRAVVIIWLFVVLILTSSYTASLSSILTVQQLSPTIQGVHSLQTSNVRIGYQSGSFVKDYLSRELKIDQSRLVPLNSPESYAEALSWGTTGGVGAIIDELPYVQSLLATHCDLTIAGQTFTNGGWGFAFPKDSQLAIDISTAILALAEGGELQKVHDIWLPPRMDCKNQKENSSQLNVSSFWGLFLIIGLVSGITLSFSIIRMIWKNASSSSGEGSSTSRSLFGRLRSSL